MPLGIAEDHTAAAPPTSSSATTDTSSHLWRSVRQIKLDIKATSSSVSLPLPLTDNNFIGIPGLFAEPIAPFRIEKLRFAYNILLLKRPQARAWTIPSMVICAGIIAGLLLPTTVRSQEFRQPNLPEKKRTLRARLVGSAARIQDGLQTIRKNEFDSPANPDFSFSPEVLPFNQGPLTQPPVISPPPAARPATSPAKSLADFGDDGFLEIELGKGGLTPYPSSQSSQTGSPNRQQAEELPPPLLEQTEFDTDGLEEIRQNFPDGQPRIVRFVAQDEEGNYYNHGPWKVFNHSQPQTIVAIGAFKHGRMEGQWQRHHDAGSGGLFATKPFDLYKGPFLSVATFENGKLNGVWSIYDAYQRNIFEVSYKDGIRQGKATWWYPNRSKMRETTFKDGLLDGEILAWDESEQLTRREEFVEGRRIISDTTFYKPDQKKTEDYFLDAQLIHEGEDNWWDANPAPYVPIGTKVQNGSSMKWYENKQIMQQGQYKDGKKVGQFTSWHSNGNKQTEGFYIEGKKNRLWTWWYENGMKQFEGVYKDDQPFGYWRSWHADGQLRKQEDFSLQSAQDTSADDEPAETEPLQPGSVIGPPAEQLPIPNADVETRASTPLPNDSSFDVLEGIEPLNAVDPVKPGPAPQLQDAPDPDSESEIGKQSDGSLPPEWFKRKSAVK